MPTQTNAVPDERLDLYDEAVPWAVRERHLRRYVDAVCWVMEYREGRRGHSSWCDLGCGSGYGLDIIRALTGIEGFGIDNANGPEDRIYRADLAKKQMFSRIVAWTGVISAIEFLEHLLLGQWLPLLEQLPSRCEIFVGTCPIGHDGPNPLNPHHLFEPTPATLERMLSDHFTVQRIEYGGAVLTTGEAQETAMFLCVP